MMLESPEGQRKLKLLLVEDDPADELLVSTQLDEAFGSTAGLSSVTTIADAIKALEASGAFDCILLDLGLPDAERLEGLETLREVIDGEAVVVLSGVSDERLAVEALSAGAHDYLSKADASTQLLRRTILYAVERARIDRDLRRMALTDALTGLSNRAVFEGRLAQVVAGVERSAELACLAFIDLNGLKFVNDRWGHQRGDRLLRTAAQRVQGVVRPSDTAARLGGDEFGVLADRIPDIRAATEIADRLATAISVAPIDLGGIRVSLAASVGIRMFGRGTSAAEAMRDADLAMYEAKRSGKGWAVVDRDGTLSLSGNA